LLGIKKTRRLFNSKTFLENVPRKNSDVLIWDEIVLKNRTTFFKLNKIELAVKTLFILITKLFVQSGVYIYPKVVK